MSKEKLGNKRTLLERPVAKSAALPDICNRERRLHVRCLAYSATGRLQFLGIRAFNSLSLPVKTFLRIFESRGGRGLKKGVEIDNDN
jgi:hypothetical protein